MGHVIDYTASRGSRRPAVRRGHYKRPLPWVCSARPRRKPIPTRGCTRRGEREESMMRKLYGTMGIGMTGGDDDGGEVKRPRRRPSARACLAPSGPLTLRRTRGSISPAWCSFLRQGGKKFVTGSAPEADSSAPSMSPCSGVKSRRTRRRPRQTQGQSALEGGPGSLVRKTREAIARPVPLCPEFKTEEDYGRSTAYPSNAGESAIPRQHAAGKSPSSSSVARLKASLGRGLGQRLEPAFRHEMSRGLPSLLDSCAVVGRT